MVLRLDVDPIRHAVPPPYTFIMGVYTPDLPLVLCHIFRLLASGEIHRYSGKFCRIFYGGMYTICRHLRIVLRRGWGGGQPCLPCGWAFYHGLPPQGFPFLTLFHPSPFDPSGAKFLIGVGADSISARAILRCHQIPRANTVRPYNALFRQSGLPFEGSSAVRR